MGWMGKLIGGTLGFAIGGPLGAIAGAAFGHAFDRTGEAYGVGETARTLTGEEAQFTFFVATFSMLAKLAKADGRISKDEIDSINRFMLDDLNLNPQSRMVAMNIFNAAMNSRESFDDFAAQFYRQFYGQPQILEVLIDILLRVSVADGQMSGSEENLILSAVRIFNFNDAAYQTLKSKYVQAFEKYYAILQSTKQDTDDHIKKQYRKLVMEYHPDKIISKGLPEEFNQFAHDKFREIQEAYEIIKKERGIK
ncbi:MAG: co-chaperone DjlA [Deltaproteobacteria bacterium]|nr:MAG: co-chaperone DjlA [Deltaproteobacteria bacterium]